MRFFLLEKHSLWAVRITECSPPAMAIGLTAHVWSYREYIWLQVPTDPALTQQMDERIARLLIPALQD